MTSLFIVADVISAAVALLMTLLVARGFAPHIRLEGGRARRALLAGIILSVIALAARTAWWDLGHIVAGWMGLLPQVERPTSWAVFNLAVNLTTIGGAVGFLAALFYTIPPEDREGYSWISAAFYPPKRRRLRPTPPGEDLPL